MAGLREILEDRRTRRAAILVCIALFITASAVQNPTVVARQVRDALAPGAAQRLAMAHPIEVADVHLSVMPLLRAIANGEQIREEQVVAAAAQQTLERARREAAAALSGDPQPWLTGTLPPGGLPGYIATSPGGFATPARGVFSSGFGPRWGSFHQGIDIAGPIGTPVYAFAAGTVVDAGPAQGFGLWVRIRHVDGTTSVYGHLYDFWVSVGERVPAGMQIGRMGNRGDSTGPHLHFEIHAPNGTPMDPVPWLALRGVSVTG